MFQFWLDPLKHENELFVSLAFSTTYDQGQVFVVFDDFKKSKTAYLIVFLRQVLIKKSYVMNSHGD